eukprot:CAMPEP_0185792484 /NCGR_PEP_ID=MMETSP1174-20130828/158958_1 /TAXON_ID=35687 /ORGANISM="Dictyocha speculum, Strain CCMP1381" /LENGTH=296 /DNA_ID=CAMNT_0028487555 /DNA_START=951 /DNA_END=1841 /DNA_ORIENTATION=-
MPLLHSILGTQPVLWLHFFLTKGGSSLERVYVLVYWASLLVLFFAIVVPMLEARLERIVVRKLFHLLAVVLFAPVTIADPDLMSLAYAGATALLVIAEAFRVAKAGAVGRFIGTLWCRFVDEREMTEASYAYSKDKAQSNRPGSALVLTPIYLLIGCALPLWISHFLFQSCRPVSGAAQMNLAQMNLAGVAAIGVGDAMAAIVGKTIGRNKWPDSSRTFEGSFSFWIGLVVFYTVMQHSIFSDAAYHAGITANSMKTSSMGYKCVLFLMVSLLEACTTQMDNLVLPLFTLTGLGLC